MAEGHPLVGMDDWERYDSHISERNRLIDGKRAAEDNFIKTVIQLSSGIALLVPGYLFALSEKEYRPSDLLALGLLSIFIALVAGLSEQFLSSIAYAKQLEKTDKYYAMVSGDVSTPTISRFVAGLIVISFGAFLFGVVLISLSLIYGPWR